MSVENLTGRKILGGTLELIHKSAHILASLQVLLCVLIFTLRCCGYSDVYKNQLTFPDDLPSVQTTSQQLTVEFNTGAGTTGVDWWLISWWVLPKHQGIHSLWHAPSAAGMDPTM